MAEELRLVLVGCLVIIVLSLGVMYQRDLSLKKELNCLVEDIGRA